MLFAWVLLAALTVTQGCSRTPKGVSAVSGICRDSWSEPQTIQGASPRDVARFASVSAVGKELVVVGNNIPFFLPEPAPQDLFFGYASGTPLGGPSGDLLLAYPIIAHVSGKLVLVWGEADTRDTLLLPAWPPPITRLLFSIRDLSGQWTEPSQLITATQLRWSPDRLNSLSVSPAGAMHVAVPAELAGGVEVIAVLRFDGSAWQQSILVPPTSAAYASVTESRDGRVLLAFVGADSIGTDVNSVFVATSSDGAKSFGPPRIVSRSGNAPAHGISALAAQEQGRFHLLWAQDTSADGAPDVLRHVSSSDAGSTWSPVDDVAPPVGFRPPVTTIDGAGTIHAVYEDWSGGGADGHLDYVCWSGGWSDITHLHPSLTAMSPALHASADGTLYLVFLARPRNAAGLSPFTTMVSQR